MSSVHTIDDPETLRLIADPLRLRLLELVRQQPRTVTELADLLDVPRTKLYYHVKLLEEHNLLAVDTTRVISGITEKRYRVTAYRFSVDKSILGTDDSDASSLDVFLSVVLDEAAGEIRRSVASGLIDLDLTSNLQVSPRQLTMGRTWFELDDTQLQHFGEKLFGLVKEFDAIRTKEETAFATIPAGKALYEWLVAFYPVVPPERDEVS